MDKKFKKILSKIIVIFMVLCMILPITRNAYAKNFEQNPKEGAVVVAFYVTGLEAYLYDTSTKSFAKSTNGGIYRYGSYGDTVLSFGTGWFVGENGENPQYLITNNHVIESFTASNEGGKGYCDSGKNTGSQYKKTYEIYYAWTSCELRVYYSENDYESVYVVDHGETDKVDLALLRLQKPTTKRVPLQLYVPDESMQADTVYTVGYPGTADASSFTEAHKWGMDDVKFTVGTIGKFGMANNGVERILTDAVIHHGNSGGPLVDEDGYVIGVNTNSIQNGSEIDYYSITCRHVVEMLDKNNVKYEDAQKNKEAAKAKSMIVTVLIIVGVVVVLMVVAVIIIVNVVKKKKRARLAEANANAPVNATPVVNRTPEVPGYGTQPTPVAPAPQPASVVSEASKYAPQSTPVAPAQPAIKGYDPMTGKPIYEETPVAPAQPVIKGYDPMTGKPIYEEPAAPKGYDPMTGKPIY